MIATTNSTVENSQHHMLQEYTSAKYQHHHNQQPQPQPQQPQVKEHIQMQQLRNEIQQRIQQRKQQEKQQQQDTIRVDDGTNNSSSTVINTTAMKPGGPNPVATKISETTIQVALQQYRQKQFELKQQQFEMKLEAGFHNENNTINAIDGIEDDDTDHHNGSTRGSLFRNCTSPERNVPWPFHTNDSNNNTTNNEKKKNNTNNNKDTTNHYSQSSSTLNPHLKCGIGIGIGGSTSNGDDSSNGGSNSTTTTTQFVDYFRDTIKHQQIEPILQQENCSQLVVFGVAFGDDYIQDMRTVMEPSSFDEQVQQDKTGTPHSILNSTDLLRRHGNCFFMFTHPYPVYGIGPGSMSQLTALAGKMGRSSSSSSAANNTVNININTTTTSDNNENKTVQQEEIVVVPEEEVIIGTSTKIRLMGHTWLIPIPPDLLPYQNSRRNAKLLKYMGHYAFLPPNYNKYNNEQKENTNIKSSATITTTTSTTESNTDTHTNNNYYHPQHIIWQDAKFFRYGFVYSIPRDYSTLLRPPPPPPPPPPPTTNQQQQQRQSQPHQQPLLLPCVTTMGLPIKPTTYNPPITTTISVGLAVSTYTQPQYKDHCQTIINALKERPGVTDSPQSLMEQCIQYLHYVQQQQQQQSSRRNSSRSTSTSSSANYDNDDNNNDNNNDHDDNSSNLLNYGLIDSAFIIWNESTQLCRDFNAMVRCSLLDQLQCHSDRDQVVFPLLVYTLLSTPVPSLPTSTTTTAALSRRIVEEEEEMMKKKKFETNTTTTVTEEEADENKSSSSSTLKATYYNGRLRRQMDADDEYKPHYHDLDLIQRSSTNNDDNADNEEQGQQQQQQIFVRITRSSCHWYYYEYKLGHPLGERICGRKFWLNEKEISLPSLSSSASSLSLASGAVSSELQITVGDAKNATTSSSSIASNATIGTHKSMPLSSASTPSSSSSSSSWWDGETIDAFRTMFRSNKFNESLHSIDINPNNRDTLDRPFMTDFNACSSPEFKKVPWTFSKTTSAPTSTSTSTPITTMVTGQNNGSDKNLFPLSCGTTAATSTENNDNKSHPFQRLIQLATSTSTQKNDNKNHYFQKLIGQLAQNCPDLIVFGVLFGTTNIESKLNPQSNAMYNAKRSKMQQHHGKCFFVFVLKEDMKNQNTKTISAGQNWLIPVEKSMLPYTDMKRNVKLFQYSAHTLFPHTHTIVYQDVKFFSVKGLSKQPVNYHEIYPKPKKKADGHADNDEPCVTTFAMPKNRFTIGTKNLQQDTELFIGHCTFILTSAYAKLKAKTPAADNPLSIVQQCEAYIQYIYARELDTHILNQGMIDTDFMSWYEGTETCRAFNAKLRCIILDHLHCHSTRDALVFPFAVYQMGGLHTEYNGQPQVTLTHRGPVDDLFSRRQHDLNFVQEIATTTTRNNKGDNKNNMVSNTKQDMIRIIRSRRHWSYRYLDSKYPTKKKP